MNMLQQTNFILQNYWNKAAHVALCAAEYVPTFSNISSVQSFADKDEATFKINWLPFQSISKVFFWFKQLC